jgi:hypothetical protein
MTELSGECVHWMKPAMNRQVHADERDSRFGAIAVGLSDTWQVGKRTYGDRQQIRLVVAARAHVSGQRVVDRLLYDSVDGLDGLFESTEDLGSNSSPGGLYPAFTCAQVSSVERKACSKLNVQRPAR